MGAAVELYRLEWATRTVITIGEQSEKDEVARSRYPVGEGNSAGKVPGGGGTRGYCTNAFSSYMRRVSGQQGGEGALPVFDQQMIRETPLSESLTSPRPIVAS